MTEIALAGWPMASDSGYSCRQTQYLRDAIAKVQRQKQRPTASRIFKAVRQCIENITLEQVTNWLQLAVHTGELVMVDNDGIVSYRESRRTVSSSTASSAQNNVPVVSLPETQCWPVERVPDAAWPFVPAYGSFRELGPQSINPSESWRFATGRPPLDAQFTFGTERGSESYSSWNKSFGAATSMVDPGRVMFTNETVQPTFNHRTEMPHLYEPSTKCSRIDYDENRARHSNGSVDVVRTEPDFSKKKYRHAGMTRTDFPFRPEYYVESPTQNSQQMHCPISGPLHKSNSDSYMFNVPACHSANSKDYVSNSVRIDCNQNTSYGLHRSGRTPTNIPSGANHKKQNEFGVKQVSSVMDSRHIGNGHLNSCAENEKLPIHTRAASNNETASSRTDCEHRLAPASNTLTEKDDTSFCNNLYEQTNNFLSPSTVALIELNELSKIKSRLSPQLLASCVKETSDCKSVVADPLVVALHDDTVSSSVIQNDSCFHHSPITETSFERVCNKQLQFEEFSKEPVDDNQLLGPAIECDADASGGLSCEVSSVVDEKSCLPMVLPAIISEEPADDLPREAPSDADCSVAAEPGQDVRVDEEENDIKEITICELQSASSCCSSAVNPSSNNLKQEEVKEEQEEEEKAPVAEAAFSLIEENTRVLIDSRDDLASVVGDENACDTSRAMKCNEEDRRPIRIYSGLNPRGLIDGLTRFFTPSDRRGPRVCREGVTLSPWGSDRRRNRSSESVASSTSAIDVTADLRKPRVEFARTFDDAYLAALPLETSLASSSCASTSTSTSPCRRRHAERSSRTSRPREQLFDGLSHFFMAVGKRRSCIPLRLRPEDSIQGNEFEHSKEDEGVTPEFRTRTLSAGEESASGFKLRQQSMDVISSSTEGCHEKSESNHGLQFESESFSGTRRTTDSAHRASCCNSVSYSDVLPPVVMYPDLIMFKKAQRIALERRPGSRQVNTDTSSGPNPSSIQFGQHHISASFSSHYPSEYASLPILYICEFCLKYMKSAEQLHQHTSTCYSQCPPGREIYRDVDGALSIYELEGNTEDSLAAIYCVNLMLFSELFLDHKPANVCTQIPASSRVFYILTKRDEDGARHFVGCFFKEAKMGCDSACPLSGLFVLPPYRRKGFGDFLVRFCYRLQHSERSNVAPCNLSPSINSRSFLQSCLSRMIVRFLLELSTEQRNVTVKDIIETTGIALEDAVVALQSIGLVPSETLSIRDSTVIDIDSNEFRDAVRDLKPDIVGLDFMRFRRLPLERTTMMPLCDLAEAEPTDKRYQVCGGVSRIQAKLPRRIPMKPPRSLGCRKDDSTAELAACRRPKRKTLRNLTVARAKKFRLVLQSSNKPLSADEAEESLNQTSIEMVVPQTSNLRPSDDEISQPIGSTSCDKSDADISVLDADDRCEDDASSQPVGHDENCCKMDTIEFSALPTKFDDNRVSDSTKSGVDKVLRVSVAVQTDAYDSEYSDDDDDSSSSSGSWESDESSVEEEAGSGDVRQTNVNGDDDRKNCAEVKLDSVLISDSECSRDGSCSDEVTAEDNAFPQDDEKIEAESLAETHSVPAVVEPAGCLSEHTENHPIGGTDGEHSCKESLDDAESPCVGVYDSPESAETDDESETDSICRHQSMPLPKFGDESERCQQSANDEVSRASYDGRTERDRDFLSASGSVSSPSFAARAECSRTVGSMEHYDTPETMRSDDVLLFKTPEQSPVDNRFGPASVSYQPGSAVSGSYGSSPSMYCVLDGSPSCAAVNQACLSVNGNAISYSLPTPSPTNSSSRSFSMASPSSNGCQQPSSVSGTPAGFQFEQPPSTPTAGYMQETTRLPPSIASASVGRVVNSFRGTVAPEPYFMPATAYHYGQTVSPSADTPSRGCPGTAFGYGGGGSKPFPHGMNNVSGAAWQQIGQQQQLAQYHHQQHSVGFFPQHVTPEAVRPAVNEHLNVVSQVTAAAGCRPGQRNAESKTVHRRTDRNVNKSYSVPTSTSYRSGVADVAAPNVTLQPGTNVITGYSATMMYETPPQSFSSGYRKSSSVLGHGSSIVQRPPSNVYANADNQQYCATYGYPNGYSNGSDRYQAQTFAPSNLQMDSLPSAYSQQQRLVAGGANFSPAQGLSRVHGSMYPNVAAAYDTYMNGSFPSYGMR